jgi:hypothetical protein
MRKIREMLRLKWVAQRSHREVARSLGVSAGAVASAVGRARVLGLTWEALEALTDNALEQRLYGPRAADVTGQRPDPDLAWVHRELRRPGVTLELLHVEYLTAHPNRVSLRGLLRAVSGVAGAAVSTYRAASRTRVASIGRGASARTDRVSPPRASSQPRILRGFNLSFSLKSAGTCS